MLSINKPTIMESVLVFLFPHYNSGTDILERDIFKYLVSVDYFEAISGPDFFSEYIEVA